MFHRFLEGVRILPFAEAWPRMIDMLECAQALLDLRMVHLDMKLDNMLLDGDGRLLLCDLGEAVVLVSSCTSLCVWLCCVWLEKSWTVLWPVACPLAGRVADGPH